MKLPASVVRAWADIQRNFDATAEALTPEAFIHPTFQNGYANYALGQEVVSFYRFMSRVYLQGLIVKNVAVVAGETMFTLPVRYRPVDNVIFYSAGNSTLTRVDVGSNGAVLNYGPSGGGGAPGGFLSLSGMSFRTA